MSPGASPTPLFDADSTMTAMPLSVYFSDEDGTRGELFYRPPGQGTFNQPTIWCWQYRFLPGWQDSPTNWTGADWIITN
jgi:hypothetical protein